MNGLSILLYVANVAHNVQQGLIAIAICAGFGISVIGMIYVTSEFKDNAWQPYGPRLLRWLIVCSTLALLIPSQQTVYLIAASEAAEFITTSEDGQQLIDHVRSELIDKLGE